MNNNNLLKKLAMDAKYRMKHCTYQNREENANIIRNIAFQNQIRHIKENQVRKNEVTITIIDDSKIQRNFETKVYELLSKNEDCINPLKELSDSKIFKNLSEEEKQRYIFELSERYNRAREKYYKLKQASI